MQKIIQSFRSLSLTKQVFTVVLVIVVAFFGFFSLFLSQTVERTIANQIYDLMSMRQQTLVAVLQGDASEVLKQNYFAMSTDSFQTNCLIDGQDVTILNPSSKTSSQESFYHFLTNYAQKVNSDRPVGQGTYSIGNQTFFYRILYLSDGTHLASYMDDGYAKQLRSGLVDSTFDLMLIAYGIMLLCLVAWVYSIIHPLNQIRDYIEQIRQGKEVSLHLNRKDEIGELGQALTTMKEELNKQEKAKEEMIHNISHDLKTPIATIKSYAESIKDGIYPYGTLDKSVDVIVDNATRLEDKVHNLLYLNRVEYLLTSDASGVVTNMKEVVEAVVLNTAVLRPEISVQTDVEEVFFDGLIEAWRVAIENIMENAFRYATSYIKITVREHDLKICNDGPKMPEDRIQSLFRPFEKGEGGRFGLGLSIVNKVVKANHYLVRGFNTDDGVCFQIYRQPQKKSERRRLDINLKRHSSTKDEGGRI